MTENRGSITGFPSGAVNAWERYRESVDWTPAQIEAMPSIGFAYLQGWTARDERDIEPTKPGTIVLLHYASGPTLAATRLEMHWQRLGRDSGQAWLSLIAGIESWEMAWEPS